MNNEFVREGRYIVFKLSDVERYLTDKDRANITMMKMEIDAGRDCANKPPFKGLIVEADWPEYEPTWRAIEARATGAQPAPIERSIATKTLSEMFLSLDGRDKAQPGYEWRKGWNAAIRQAMDYAQPVPSVPDGWLRAIDEALVTARIGVANAEDTYEQAKPKLDNLIGFHVGVATDPAVNGGYKPMPVEPTNEIYECFAAYDGTSYSNPFDFAEFREDYLAAINSTGLPVGAKLYALPGAQPAPSVPECPYPCGWRNLLKLAMEDGSFLARSITEDEPVSENARAVTMRMVMRLRDVLMAINRAAPEAKP